MLDAAKATAVAGRGLFWATRHPLWPGFGEPFNGQAERTQTICALVDTLKPAACIETGTFYGFTAARLAEFGVPVYTVERDVGFFNVSRLRLLGKRNVHVVHGDSASVLPKLAANPNIRRPLVYLDAHWGDGLPLVSEVATILEAWTDCVIVVDDFLVPNDPDYGYDTYSGQPLTLSMFSLPHDVAVAFPSLPASRETGARRGTLYVGQGEGAVAIESLIGSGRLVCA